MATVTVRMPVTAITRDKMEHRCAFVKTTICGDLYECDRTCKDKNCDVYTLQTLVVNDDNTESA